MGKKPVQLKYLRDAVRYVEKWVPRLRIENYDIEVIGAPDDFEEYAEAEINPLHLRASITVRDPAKPFTGRSLACKDLEVTMVHELLHVRFAEVILELEGKARSANEIATEMTAMALVAADRGIEPRVLIMSF